jgi:hypothetical protein
VIFWFAIRPTVARLALPTSGSTRWIPTHTLAHMLATPYLYVRIRAA